VNGSFESANLGLFGGPADPRLRPVVPAQINAMLRLELLGEP